MDTGLDSFRILGVKINALTVDRTFEIMNQWIMKGERNYVVLTGAHGIIEMQKNKDLRAINNASGLTTPDGMPEVWLGKMKGFKDIEKVYAPDIMVKVFRDGVTKGYRHFFYGGKEGVADALATEVRKRFPGIKVVGTYCPPFRSLTDEERESVVRSINESQADIVWCGLGCPKQEKWMADFRPRLTSPVLIGVGAGFDFLAGTRALAPGWVKNSGLEWLYRLVHDPKHLWKRYVRVVPLFIALTTLEILGLYRQGKQTLAG